MAMVGTALPLLLSFVPDASEIKRSPTVLYNSEVAREAPPNLCTSQSLSDPFGRMISSVAVVPAGVMVVAVSRSIDSAADDSLLLHCDDGDDW